MKRARGFVARMPGVKDDRAPPASAEHESRAQTRRSAPDDDGAKEIIRHPRAHGLKITSLTNRVQAGRFASAIKTSYVARLTSEIGTCEAERDENNLAAGIIAQAEPL